MPITCRRIFLLFFATLCSLYSVALTPDDDLETTIKKLHVELQNTQENINLELETMQKTRVEYWKHIQQLQKDIDKAVLVLYSQDGGSLFGLGLASDGIHDVCEAFKSEKVPFEKWLESMSVASSKHQHIRKALEKIHQENLSQQHKDYVRQSIAICDSLDRQFSAVRDSIAVDKERYLKMASEIAEIEKTNKIVVNNLRDGIFNDNDEDFITLMNSLELLEQDMYYDGKGKADQLNDQERSTAAQQIEAWDSNTMTIAFFVWILGSIAMRFLLPKKSPFRARRRYYTFLAAIGLIIVSSWLMPFLLDNNSYLAHIEDVYTDFYLFLFLVILSAVLRLPKPGLGWSVVSYMPYIFCCWTVILLALQLTRTSLLKSLLFFLFFFLIFIILAIAIFVVKRVKKEDYAESLSMLGIVVLCMILTFCGYYYLTIILLLYSMSVITCLSGFVCFKILFKKRLERVGPIMHLTLTHLIYPWFYIYTFMGSLYSVAYIFNLNTWLSEQLSTPFINIPQFGIISIGRLFMLGVLAVFVNYGVKLIKQILKGMYKTKYETGNIAVAVTVGTIVVWFGYLLTALYILRINHSGILAAIGGASLGLGFAMKDTFENFFCGLSLMASRARPGDIVECDGARGVIKKIGIMSTQIQIEDGPIVLFPNRQIFERNFTNLTINRRREIRHIIFDISDSSDLEKAKTLMLQAAEGIDGVVDIENHYVVMKHTSCGIVRLDYKCWIDSSQYLRTEPAVREAIFNAFKANGIEIASFPLEIDMRATSMIMDNKS